MSDDEILGRILRRFLTDEDEWSTLTGAELVLDGRIRLTDDEAAAVDRALHPEPVRRVRLGEKVDLAPHEVVDVVAASADGSMTALVLRIDGGPGGMKGVRFG